MKLIVKFVSFCTTVLLIILTPSVSHADKVLILGDSLSAAYNIPWDSGWAQLLAEDMASDHQLINASVSGETTGGGIARLEALIKAHSPDWVVIELGGNDGLRGYPLKVIRENLTRLGNMSLENGAKPIFLGIQIPPNYGQRYSDAFSAIFSEVAAQADAPYLNLFDEEIVHAPGMMLDDKLHPSEVAQPLIRDRVYAFLHPVLYPAK